MALGLYVHIPFCQHICAYCNFNRGVLDADLKRSYVDALVREIESTKTSGVNSADTIFFGGGTPSLLEPDEVRRIIAACRRTFDLAADAEITLETNPETVDADRLAAFRDAGVTRVSFGVQSFDDDELRRLDRIHSAETAVQIISAARGLGFASVSIDLMLWLPEQTPASWRRTLDRAIGLRPDHLSLYLLELYPNAPLKETMARERWSQTADDDAADMYLEGLASLDAAGYMQYEISNVARAGHRSRHNVKYWQSGDWYGFGCGAHATVSGVRWHNVASTTEYVARVTSGQSVRVEERRMTPEARAQEALFTGLRMTDGIDEAAFAARWGFLPWIRFAASLELRLQAGHVWRQGGRFGLTRNGMLVANDVLAIFV